MIGHAYDLGSAGVLWKRPQIYAKFLAQELASFHKCWLLVVMPNGYGIYHCVPKKRPGGYSDPCENGMPTGPDEKLLASLPKPAASGRDLAVRATDAVQKLAGLHGAGSGGGGVAKPIAGVLVLLALGGGGSCSAAAAAGPAPRRLMRPASTRARSATRARGARGCPRPGRPR
jgi:hypothetical protein